MNQPIDPLSPETAQRVSRGAFRCHAQSLEDAALWKALRDVRAGQYLDIGAYEPLRDSVSAGFYDRGWRGISVDPLPGLAALYEVARPDEPFVGAAVSNRAGSATLARVQGTGLSAIDGAGEDRVTVDTIPLSDLFDRLDGTIHWLKIDVEGHEGAVIDSWGDHAARPWILCIECDDGPDPDWHQPLLDRDYALVRSDGLNRFYLHNSQDGRRDALVTAPGVLDHILITQWSGLSEIPGQLVSLAAERDSMKTIMEAQDQALKDHRFAITAGNEAQTHLHRHVERLEQDLSDARKQLETRPEQVTPPDVKPKPVALDPQVIDNSADTRLARLKRRTEVAETSHNAALTALGDAAMRAEQELVALQSTSKDLLNDRSVRHARISDLEAQVAGLRGRETHLVEEVGRYRASLNAVRSSTFWRLGAPVRAALSTVRGAVPGWKGRRRRTGRSRLYLWVLDLAVIHWRRDYKWMRPLRMYVLRRPELGRKLSMRPDHWDDSWNEVDPFDPDPSATQAILARERAADPNPVRYKLPPTKDKSQDGSDDRAPGHRPRPTLFADAAGVRSLTRALRTKARRSR